MQQLIGSAGVVKSITGTITEAQMRTLNSHPIVPLPYNPDMLEYFIGMLFKVKLTGLGFALNMLVTNQYSLLTFGHYFSFADFFSTSAATEYRYLPAVLTGTNSSYQNIPTTQNQLTICAASADDGSITMEVPATYTLYYTLIPR